MTKEEEIRKEISIKVEEMFIDMVDKFDLRTDIDLEELEYLAIDVVENNLFKILSKYVVDRQPIIK